MDNIVIFSLSSSKELAKEIAGFLGVEKGEIAVTRFADGEILVEPQQSVRGKHVFIIQSTCDPVNDTLMEVLICLDACRRASCREVTCVIPYYGYARQDRKARARQPITARLVADLIQAAGADRVVAVDLHAPQIQGYFKIPSDNLTAVDMIGKYFRNQKMHDVVVVSPDHGGAIRARNLANSIPNSTIAIIDKRRVKPNLVEAMSLIGDVKGKDCIIIDDLVDTGGSLLGCIKLLKEYGALDIYCAATHGVFSKNAMQKIAESGVKEFVITNSIERSEEELAKVPNVKVLSIALLLAKSIESIATNTPISNVYKLFHSDEEEEVLI
ncbi:MAG TPA: ribose-phosphate pyrophosphokinase [Erysipelotrichaceae bacterium]|nr:ribose-phosphate pyrophosphokinase [Erysipelotrichaceae bacterium]